MEQGIETLGEWIEKYNPFALKSKTGKIRYFENYRGAYLYTMKRVRKRSKNGYFDMVLFFLDEIMNDKETAEDMVRLMGKQYRMLKGSYLLIDWEDTAHNYSLMSSLMKGLHMVTETEFNYPMFELAWEDFKNWEATYEDVDNASEDSDSRDDEETKR